MAVPDPHTPNATRRSDEDAFAPLSPPPPPLPNSPLFVPQIRYPNPEGDWDCPFRHLSYLNRSQGQWEWLKENALPAIVERASADANRYGDLEIRVAVLGASFGEELARTFHEVTDFLVARGSVVATSPGENCWKVRVHGVEIDERVVQAAKRRLQGDEPFFYLPLPNQSYASDIVSTLERYHGILGESLIVTQGSAVDYCLTHREKPPHILLVNNILYLLSPESEERLVVALDSNSSDAWIAIAGNGGNTQVGKTYRAFYSDPNMERSHYKVQYTAVADRENYEFLVPRTQKS